MDKMSSSSSFFFGGGGGTKIILQHVILSPFSGVSYICKMRILTSQLVTKITKDYKLLGVRNFFYRFVAIYIILRRIFFKKNFFPKFSTNSQKT